MANYLVTGGAGFIGSHLCRKLESLGHKVVSLDNMMHPCENPFDSKFADVRYSQDIVQFFKGCDACFHLAAQISVDRSIHSPQETIDINVNGTLTILELCRKHNVKLVFASTSEVYGTAQNKKMDESHPLDAQSPYGASKLAADRLCKSYIDTYGLDISILRNFNTFGPYQGDDSYGGVIAIFTKAALAGKDLNIFGSGEQERDYMWVDDAVNAYLKVVSRKGVFNAGSGTTIKVNRIAHLIKELSKSKSRIVHIKSRPGEVQRLCCNAGKIKKLGWKPKASIEEGIKKYVGFYKNSFL
ncbi:MAG: GDP-mannose 4,6-dehydratase [bacterium]